MNREQGTGNLKRSFMSEVLQVHHPGRLAAVTLGLAGTTAMLVRLAMLDVRQSGLFHPHGYCYLWMPSLVGTHVLADALIGLSYVAISLTLVWVDDDEDSRETVTEILTAAGAETAHAHSAASGLARVIEDAVDVIVSDIAMPERDGIAFIEDVRRLPDPKRRRTPAVALTALAREDDRRRILSAGFQRHVPKPVTAAQLVQSVASLRPSQEG